MLKEEQLKEWNRKGVIPGPSESEEEFEKRAYYCLHIKDHLQNAEFGLGEVADTETTGEAFPLTKKLFDIQPDWVPVFYSNYKLAPWHGGCAWIFQLTTESPLAALFQLRSSFRTSKTYLGLYSKKELMAHELSHIGRMAFQEPAYEEMLAYCADSTVFRRWLGPIVQSSWESLFFVGLIATLFLFDAMLIAADGSAYYSYMIWNKLLALAVIGAAGVRLLKKHRRMNTTLSKLQSIAGVHANAILYRLTDDEITQFSKFSESQILDYIRNDNSLRWRVIKLEYLYPRFFLFFRELAGNT